MGALGWRGARRRVATRTGGMRRAARPSSISAGPRCSPDPHDREWDFDFVGFNDSATGMIGRAVWRLVQATREWRSVF
jgi:hypothetical protein